MAKEKFRISIIDFMLENGKHEAGKDKNGNTLYLGDVAEYNGENNWFVSYRYGMYCLKQVGTIFTIILNEKTDVERQKNVLGAGVDWLIIGYTDEPLYEKVKHIKDIQLTPATP